MNEEEFIEWWCKWYTQETKLVAPNIARKRMKEHLAKMKGTEVRTLKKEAEADHEYITHLEKKNRKGVGENKRLNKMLDKYDLQKFADWICKQGYADSDLWAEGGVEDYIKSLEE